MSSEIRSFRDLVVWQRAIQLAGEVYIITKRFPRDERFGLTNQLRRAAVSVSSNIAEGHARQGNEFLHFLSIARGSLAEVESQLQLSVVLQFVSDIDIAQSLNLVNEVGRMVSSLTAKLRESRSS